MIAIKKVYLIQNSNIENKLKNIMIEIFLIIHILQTGKMHQKNQITIN